MTCPEPSDKNQRWWSFAMWELFYFVYIQNSIRSILMHTALEQ
jgi:hypothetical protein